jgi:hypothetical protein
LGALLGAVARGIDVHCGCFSTETSGPVHTVWYVARDLLLLLLGICVMILAFGARSEDDRRRGR